jgi:hypothetical protein
MDSARDTVTRALPDVPRGDTLGAELNRERIRDPLTIPIKSGHFRRRRAHASTSRSTCP